MSATQCPKGPGSTKPHTWKRGKRWRDTCWRCGQTRAQANGRPEPQVRVGAWACVQTMSGRWRGYVERIDGGMALLRGANGADDGTIWPFPYEGKFPLSRLRPAPTPRFVEAK